MAEALKSLYESFEEQCYVFHFFSLKSNLRMYITITGMNICQYFAAAEILLSNLRMMYKTEKKNIDPIKNPISSPIFLIITFSPNCMLKSSFRNLFK